MNPTTPMFLMGLVIGTGLLMTGLGLGLWLGRRMVPPNILEDSAEREQLIRFVRNFATWTSDFAGDFSKYQTQVKTLSQQAEASSKSASMSDVRDLLRQISQANQDLQSRLNSAEERLESQTKELASYLNEARTDGLTGLANRRAFDQKLDAFFSQWISQKQPFCLALIDIDFFKKINDSYGHPAGDSVLREIASQLHQFASNRFDVARYGGEEFAILMKQPLEAAARAVEQLRVTIQSHSIQVEGNPLSVTVSIGVSSILPEERVGKLVQRADEALYAAKLGGRNRVYMNDGKLCRPFGNPAPRFEAPPIVSPSENHASPSAPLPASNRQQRLQERLEKFIEEA